VAQVTSDGIPVAFLIVLRIRKQKVLGDVVYAVQVCFWLFPSCMFLLV